MLKAMARIHENFLRLLFEADRDMLTALNNRRKFDLRLFNLMATQLQSPEEQTHCTLALLDVDHFKQVNDQYGHMVGDEVLLLLAQLMQQSFREDDSLFRYGGEEFAIIFQGLAPEQAAVALERFRVRVEQYPFPQVGASPSAWAIPASCRNCCRGNWWNKRIGRCITPSPMAAIRYTATRS